MAQAGSGLLTGADLIVPVPLHRRRLISRRYKQSAVLALALAKITSVAAVPASTKVLLRGGACAVDVLTLARVVRPASK
jgi:predicted amidophosphoribosyltransferase